MIDQPQPEPEPDYPDPDDPSAPQEPPYTEPAPS